MIQAHGKIEELKLNHSNYWVKYPKEGDQGTKSSHMTKKVYDLTCHECMGKI
jgi:hypothetical protein